MSDWVTSDVTPREAKPEAAGEPGSGPDRPPFSGQSWIRITAFSPPIGALNRDIHFHIWKSIPSTCADLHEPSDRASY